VRPGRLEVLLKRKAVAVVNRRKGQSQCSLGLGTSFVYKVSDKSTANSSFDLKNLPLTLPLKYIRNCFYRQMACPLMCGLLDSLHCIVWVNFVLLIFLETPYKNYKKKKKKVYAFLWSARVYDSSPASVDLGLGRTNTPGTFQLQPTSQNVGGDASTTIPRPGVLVKDPTARECNIPRFQTHTQLAGETRDRDTINQIATVFKGETTKGSVDS